MTICPKCGHIDDYEINYIEEYLYNDDTITVLVNVSCPICDESYWVREFFKFSDNENKKKIKRVRK